MEWIVSLLIIWTVANISFILFVVREFVSDEGKVNLFIYPSLIEWLNNNKTHLFGRIVIITLFTFIFLPGLLLWYVIGIGTIMIWLAINLFLKHK